MILYQTVRAIVDVLTRLLWRRRLVGVERVPRTGAFILAPSHRSIVDAFLAPMITRRRVRFMAKQELWKSKVLGRLVEALGAFPVDRDATDRTALRRAMACIEAGEPLVVFPEGTRRRGDRIEDLHDGAAYLASRLQVPIVPIGIAGTEEIMPKGAKLPRLRRVTIVVGESIDPPRRARSVKRSDVRSLTADLAVGLQKAFDEARATLHR